MNERRWYTKEEVSRRSGTSVVTVARWGLKLRMTRMVRKVGKYVCFDGDFITFIRTRKETTGRPSGLPEPKRIAELVRMFSEGLSLEKMAEKLEEDKVTIDIQLMSLDLKKENIFEEEKWQEKKW
jgi:hypothetical protein